MADDDVLFYEPKPCAYCGGDGQVKQDIGLSDNCLSCNGQGTVLVTKPATPCKPCGGTGRRSNQGVGYSDRCMACEGTGWFHIYHPNTDDCHHHH